jgi:hypothetical protein
VVDVEAGRRAVLHGPPHARQDRIPPGVDLVELRTDVDYLPAVQSMLEARERRRAHH